MSQQNQEEDNLLAQPSISNPTADAKKKKMKCIIISGAVVVALVVLTVVLVVVLRNKSGGGDKPEPPGPGPEPTSKVNNPYNVQNFTRTDHGYQQYHLERDSRIDTLSQGKLETSSNKFIDHVNIRSQLLNYETARIQIFQNDSDKLFTLPNEYLNKDYNSDFKKGLLFNAIGFDVAPEKTFYMRLYDLHSNFDYVTTEGEPFVVMSNYMQIGFTLESSRLFGFGERTRDFELLPGKYTCYPKNNGPVVDDGSSSQGKEQQSQHPFLVAQLRNSTFFGIFIYNSNPQQIELSRKTYQADNETKTLSKVVFTAAGGPLDIFFFMGPSYLDVLRQYQKVIGYPIMLPLSAHGLYLKSDAYVTGTAIDKDVKFFTDQKIPFNGVSLPWKATDNQYTFTFLGYSLSDLIKLYPTVKWILPWKSFIAKAGETAIDLLRQSNLIVSVNGNGVIVTDEDKGEGFCLDYFNPNITQFLDQWFSKLDMTKIIGFSLEDNAPQFKSNNFTGDYDLTVNPFKDIPFWPGDKSSYGNSLPPFAQHNYDYNKTSGQLIYTYHQNLHAAFGTEMALQVKQASSAGFVISDSTFPGAGTYQSGMAHVFTKTKNDWVNLKYTVSQILNFNMFGIPYSGHNVCGFYQKDLSKDEKETLCIRSFQLSFVTPIAQFYTDEMDFTNYSPDTIRSINSVLTQRLAFIMYQRSQLHKIQHIGGALVRPMFAEFSHYGNLYTPDMVDAVMYGDAVKVDFLLEPKQVDKTLIQPGNWLDLTTFQILTSAANNTYKYTGSNIANIVMLKEGNIIPLQFVKGMSIQSTEQLKELPMDIVAFLDSYSNTAFGNVLVEEGDGKEYYEVRATKNMMSFKQQNEGRVPTSNINKQIRKILVSYTGFDKQAEYSACAVLQDHKTVQQLYVIKDAANKKMIIQARNPDVAGDTTNLNIEQLLFVFYGMKNNLKCDNTLIGAKVTQKLTNFDYSRQFTLSQNLQQLVPDLDDLTFMISINSDNSIDVKIQPVGVFQGLQEDQEQELRDDPQPSFKIDEIITFNDDPFYFEIHASDTPLQVIFTTKDMGLIFAQDFSMYSFAQPLSNPDRFFGIGERKGSFFLQDNYQYSLYTNPNKLADIIQGNGRTLQFGLNGFFPIIYSQFQGATSMLSVFLSQGSKDIFFQKNKGIPLITVIQTLNHADMRINFAKKPLDLIRDTHTNTYNKNQLRIPPDWAYGQYHLTENFDTDEDMFYIYENLQKYQWPIEGFFLNLNFTNYQSLYYNKAKMGGQDVNLTLERLDRLNLTLFQILKSGIPAKSNYTNYLAKRDPQDQMCLVTREPYTLMQIPEVLGQDYEGVVAFANYYANSYKLGVYLEVAFEDYEHHYNHTRYGVQLMNNEINDVFCSGDCFRDNQYADPMPNQFYKVGVDKQLRYTMGGNAKPNIDEHNGYSLRQHLYLWRNQYQRKMFFLSSSTSEQSGRLGNIGRLIDYITPEDDPTVAVTALQSLSVLGLANIGERIALTDGKIGGKSAMQHIILQTFSPISAHQFFNPEPYQLESEFEAAASFIRFKYMLIKYTQVQAFKQTYYGDPLIRPLFIEFPDDDKVYDLVNLQYMYGPTFMVSIAKQILDSKLQTYYPQGRWCSNIYREDTPYCFNSQGEYLPEPRIKIFMKEGTITPLQDPYGTFDQRPYVNTTFDLKNVDIDLHIVFNTEGGQLAADGELLVYTDDADDTPYCYIKMYFEGNNLYFATELGDLQNCRYPGYHLGRIIVYDNTSHTFIKVKINNQGTEQALLSPGADKDYQYVDMHLQTHNIYDIQSIAFLQ